MKICKIKDCGRDYRAKGFCKIHYARFRQNMKIDAPIITRSSTQIRKICSVKNCNRHHSAHGFCRVHNYRIKKGLDLKQPIKAKTKDGFINIFGYRCVSINGKYVLFHRYIMKRHLNRQLQRKEIVHHINNDRLDNRIENLQLMTRGEHVALHHTGKPKPKKRDYPQKINSFKDWYNRGPCNKN